MTHFFNTLNGVNSNYGWPDQYARPAAEAPEESDADKIESFECQKVAKGDTCDEGGIVTWKDLRPLTSLKFSKFWRSKTEKLTEKSIDLIFKGTSPLDATKVTQMQEIAANVELPADSSIKLKANALLALHYYKNQQYEKVISATDNLDSHASRGNLYLKARSYQMLNKLVESKKVFYSIQRDNQILVTDDKIGKASRNHRLSMQGLQEGKELEEF